MLFIRDYLRSGDRFVDVGANVGVYSLWASETDGVDVIAFEPSTFSHRRAVGNVELNGLSDRIQVVRKAVGDKRGVAPLTTGLDAVNQISDSVDVTGTELVELTTLDHEMDHGAAAIIKIDVEGRELEVLRGSRGVIARHRPALIVEVNDPAGLERMLQELGYRAWSYDPQTGGLAPATLTLHCNVIALADDGDARARLCGPVIGSGRS